MVSKQITADSYVIIICDAEFTHLVRRPYIAYVIGVDGHQHPNLSFAPCQ